MSQSGLNDIFKVNEALNQLDSEDAKVRRKAAQRLGQLKDPMAIPSLVKTYQTDTNKAVKQAAASSLSNFRRLEQGNTGSSPVARRLSRLLILVLLVSVVANVVILVIKITHERTAPHLAVIPLTPASSRNSLTDDMDNRIKAIKADLTKIRPIFVSFQGKAQSKVLPDCSKPLPDTEIKEYALAPSDATAYSDLARANVLINLAADNYALVRINYNDLCKIKNIDDLRSRLTAQGGFDALVKQIDDVNNTDVNNAALALAGAIANPILPTATPTITFTPSPAPTDIPTLPPTEGPPPTAGPPTAPPIAVAPTNLPSVPPTSVPPTAIPTTPPLPTATPGLAYQGLNLANWPRYKYNLSMNYSGVTNTNAQLSGRFQLTTTYQANPLLADYEVSISDKSNILKSGLLKSFPIGLNPEDTLSVITVNDAEYQVRSGHCQSSKVPDTLHPLNLDSILIPPDVAKDLQFKPAGVDESNLPKYVAERKSNNNQTTETYTIVFSTDKKTPIHFTYSFVQPAALGSAKMVITNLSFDYQVLGLNAPVSPSEVQVPAACGATAIPPTKAR